MFIHLCFLLFYRRKPEVLGDFGAIRDIFEKLFVLWQNVIRSR